jgi:helicase MOV-10
LVAYKANADADTHLILAGDPKQLGPVLRCESSSRPAPRAPERSSHSSPIAKSLGLEQSLLERIIDRPAYKDQVDWRLCVKLVQNFRSHPSILKCVRCGARRGRDG